MTLAACLLVGGGAATAKPAAPLTPDGWGAVRIGMRMHEVERALGARLVLDTLGEGDDCSYGRLPGDPATASAFMFVKGRLARIDANLASVRTDRGVAIGDGEAKARAAYGARLKAEPHAYEDPPAKYLTWWNPARTRGVRFEIGADRKVRALYAGDKAIEYSEGCL